MGAILGRTNPDQMWVPSGNASLPGLAFEAEPSLGFYRPSAGIIAFVGSVSGVIQFPNGTVLLPAISFVTDPSTGVFSSGVSQFSVSVGGIQRFTIYPTQVAFFLDDLSLGASGDVHYTRDAQYIAAIKSTTNAQEFRVYGTTTGPKYAAIKHDGTNAYLALGVLGDLNSSKITTKSLTAMANAAAVTIAVVTIPNAIHGGSIRVTAVGTLGDGDSTQVVIATIAVSRITGAVAKAVASASAVTAATAGATANATTAVSVTAVAGAAGASNTFDIQVTVTRSAGAATNHTVTAELVLMNELATGMTIA